MAPVVAGGEKLVIPPRGLSHGGPDKQKAPPFRGAPSAEELNPAANPEFSFLGKGDYFWVARAKLLGFATGLPDAPPP
jgi:hypothetical protein